MENPTRLRNVVPPLRQITLLLLCFLPLHALAQDPETSGEVVQMESVTVEATRVERKPRIALDGRFIRNATGSGGDPLRVLNHLPSISALNDFVGILSVRGGGPEDNSYYFDRLPLGYPYHLHGIVSTLNADVIKNIAVYPGGYGAEFGSDSQAVIDIYSRTGTDTALGGKINANPIYSQAFLEGNVGERGYWYAFGRRSYMGPLFELLPSLLAVDDDRVTEVPRFWSYQGKGVYPLTHTHTLVVNAVGAYDSGKLNFTANEAADDLQGPLRSETPFDAQGIHLYSEVPDLFTSALSLTRSFTRRVLEFGEGYLYRSTQSVYALRGDMDYWVEHPNALLEAGFTLSNLPTSLLSIGARPFEEGDPDYNFRLRKDGEKIHTTAAETLYRLEGYLQTTQDLVAARYINIYTTLGMRGNYFNRTADFTLQPRGLLGMTLGPSTVINRWLSLFPVDLRLMYGDYVQNPQLYQMVLGEANPEIGQSSASHYVVTLEKVLQAQPSEAAENRTRGGGTQTKLLLTGYYKDLRDMITYNESESRYQNQRIGHVKGVEVSVEQTLRDTFRAWLSYAYTRSKRQDSPRDAERFHTYSTPHVVTLGLNYLSGSWEFGANWQYRSGTLYSPLVGREAYTNPYTKNETWLPLYGEPARTAAYHRLDLRFYLPIFSIGGWKAGVTAELWNAYNRTNYLQVRYNANYTKEVPIHQLPLVPFLAVTLEF